MTGFSSYTLLTTVFLKENDILLLIKSCYSFIKQIHPAIDKSEGLHKVVTWPGYEKNLVFLGTQNIQIVSKTMDIT